MSYTTTVMEHSLTSATGTGWEPTPWGATQRAAVAWAPRVFRVRVWQITPVGRRPSGCRPQPQRANVGYAHARAYKAKCTNDLPARLLGDCHAGSRAPDQSREDHETIQRLHLPWAPADRELRQRPAHQLR